MVYRTTSAIAMEEFADELFTSETEFPYKNYKSFAEQLLLGTGIPMKYGGGGYSSVDLLIV